MFICEQKLGYAVPAVWGIVKITHTPTDDHIGVSAHIKNHSCNSILAKFLTKSSRLVGIAFKVLGLGLMQKFRLKMRLKLCVLKNCKDKTKVSPQLVTSL